MNHAHTARTDTLTNHTPSHATSHATSRTVGGIASHTASNTADGVLTVLGRVLRAGSGERGSASLQVVIYTPLLFFTLVMITFGGRLALARQSFAQVASAAARTASLARTDAAAHAAAVAGAQAALDTVDLHCDATPQVSVSGSVTATTPGQVITATVTCPISLRDTWVPITSLRTITATATSPVDTWRGQ